MAELTQRDKEIQQKYMPEYGTDIGFFDEVITDDTIYLKLSDYKGAKPYQINTLNKDGTLLREDYYDTTTGLLTGYSKLHYDANKNLIGQDYYDADKNLISSENGNSANQTAKSDQQVQKEDPNTNSATENNNHSDDVIIKKRQKGTSVFEDLSYEGEKYPFQKNVYNLKDQLLRADFFDETTGVLTYSERYHYDKNGNHTSMDIYGPDGTLQKHLVYDQQTGSYNEEQPKTLHQNAQNITNENENAVNMLQQAKEH